MRHPSSPLTDRARAVATALELSPAHVIALLVLTSCACAGMVLLWWIGRPRPVADAALPGPTTPPASEAAASPAPRTVVVHVSGAVASEGVRELPAGSRVVDAIEAAGGARTTARTDQVNLARVLADGEQIHLPSAKDVRLAARGAGVGAADVAGAGAAGTAGAGLINLNTATATELEELPGIGTVLAERIIAQRTSAGGFTSVEQLLDVSGIGEKTFAGLRDLVTV